MPDSGAARPGRAEITVEFSWRRSTRAHRKLTVSALSWERHDAPTVAAVGDGDRTIRTAWVLCAASAVLFGAATPAAKLILDHVPPVTLAGLLYLGAAAVSLPVAARQRRVHPSRRDLLKVAGAVIIGGAIAPVLLLTGLDRTPASTASMLLNLELVATALLAWLFFGEHIGRRTTVGLAALATAGVLLAGRGGGGGLGAVLVVGACVCWGLDNNLTATATGVTPAQITLAKGAVAGTANLLIGLRTEQSKLNPGSIGWALVVGAVGYGVSIIWWVTSARRLGAARSQGVFATAPFVGMALGWVLTGDPVQASQLVALVVMVIGVALVVSSSHLHEHRHVAELHAHRHRHDDGHHDHAHAPAVSGWHDHEHEHVELVHRHPHVPDELHRHTHA